MDWKKKIATHFSQKIKFLEEEIARTKQYRIESPRRMEARYDSSRAQYQYMITALEEKLKLLVMAIKNWIAVSSYNSKQKL